MGLSPKFKPPPYIKEIEILEPGWLALLNCFTLVNLIPVLHWR